MLSDIQALLSSQPGEAGHLVDDDWTARHEELARDVSLYRDYADGRHRHAFTTEMKKMLRVQGDSPSKLAANYCKMVIRTMSDRLNIEEVVPQMENQGDDTLAKDWIADLRRDNDFDALQIDVHDSILTDAGTFVFVRYDETDKQVYFEHELAYSSATQSGVLAIYDRRFRKLEAVVKAWEIYQAKRVNIYYPDHVMRYVGGEDGGGYLPFESDEDQVIDGIPVPGRLDWTDQTGEPLGIPCYHFINNRRGYSDTGTSAISDAIGLQDIVNRTEVSMLMTSELHGFPIRWAKGFEFPQGLSPGVLISVAGDFADNPQLVTPEAIAAVNAMELGSIPQGEIIPFISMIQFVAGQISAITNTPMPGMMGSDTASGESLKQREVGLLAKVRKFQVKTGSGWEQLFRIALRLEMAFGQNAPAGIRRFNVQWRNAETRSDSDVIDNIMKVKDLIGTRESLMQIGKVPSFGYSPERVEAIMAEKDAELASAVQASAGAPDNFGNVSFAEFETGVQENLTDAEPVAPGI